MPAPLLRRTVTAMHEEASHRWNSARRDSAEASRRAAPAAAPPEGDPTPCPRADSTAGAAPCAGAGL